MKHTKGAIRAAEAIVTVQPGPKDRDLLCSVLAQIIDRETGLPELLGVAKLASDMLRRPQSYETEQHIVGVLAAAIKRAEGER